MERSMEMYVTYTKLKLVIESSLRRRAAPDF